MDHRGCNRGGANTEYTGPKSGDQDDEMCVKVTNPIVPVRTNQAIAQLRESISFKEKGIDGDYTACLPGSCAMPGRAGRGGRITHAHHRIIQSTECIDTLMQPRGYNTTE